MSVVELATSRADSALASGGDLAGSGAGGPSLAPAPRLAACLAHNVNNAMMGVIGHLELALRDAPAGTALRERIEDGVRCALLLAQRVRRLVAFAADPASAGTTALVSLSRAAAGAAERVSAARAGVGVRVDASGGDCAVRVNPALLDVALEQVVCNALEAMPAGGTLSLRVWDDGHRRCFGVSDSGPGLTPEVRRRLFEPFFTTKSFGHLGLGLALCRDVVEAQGGAIHVTTAEGQGTTVTLSFPPAEETRGPEAAGDGPAPPHAALGAWIL